jgi:hypothetical protein
MYCECAYLTERGGGKSFCNELEVNSHMSVMMHLLSMGVNELAVEIELMVFISAESLNLCLAL